jgi:choline dehydrogenase-like flavoprotein
MPEAVASYPDATEVCIIGSGAGGAVMAEQLAAAGIDVVVLERGPERNESQFGAQNELDNMIRQDFFAPGYRETLRASANDSALPGRYSMLAHTLGGSSVHWGAWSWRYRADEMRMLSRDGAIAGANLADWPIDYAELEPFYARAEQALGVAGTAGSNPFEMPRADAYPNPPHVYRPASRLIERGARQRGLHPFPTPMAINSRVHGNRAACLNHGQCAGFGCPVQAKASPLAVHIPAARASGNCRFLTDARAIEIGVDRRGHAREVSYRCGDGALRTIRARQVVVSAGSIGSATLLLASRSARFPDGLGNDSGQVGRNLMCHIFAMRNFEMSEPSLGSIGPPGNIAVDDFHASDARRGFVGGAVLGEAIDPLPVISALKAANYIGAGKRAWGRPLSDYLERYPMIGGMIAIGEDLPVAENRVDLDPDHRDGDGMALPRITHSHHANDLQLARFMEQRMAEIAEAGGALRNWGTDYTAVKTGTGHIMGTCRMGNDPGNSVIDRWCRSHEVPNLWVVDGSFFPTSGGYNPTLTIFANAYRVAAHFIAAARRLDLR